MPKRGLLVVIAVLGCAPPATLAWQIERAQMLGLERPEPPPPELMASAYPTCASVPPPEGSASPSASASASVSGTAGEVSALADAEIARNRWRFKKCYDAALKHDPTSAGVVRVTVQVDASGLPTPRVACSTPSARLANCVAEAFTAMRFPAPEGGSAVFTVPIVFSAKR